MKDAPAWNIVLIDDEEDIRDVVSIVLEDQGFSVATAENGEKGLALCRDLKPQVVLTDIRMPGMDGIQVLKTVKEEFEDMEVIVVTAFGEIDLAVRALQLDASDFVTKPIDESSLLIALDRAKKRYTSKKALKDYTGFLEREQAKTAKELIRIYSFQKNLIENSMDGILACDETGLVVTCNRQMEQMLGYEKEEVMGRVPFSEFFDDGGGEALKQALAGAEFGGKGRLFLYETLLRHRTGAHVPVQVSAAVLKEKEISNGWVCFFRDLREIRKLERELSDQADILHQDKMMSLGRLSASVVHEINNPLFGVLNYVRLMIRILERGPLDSEDAKKFMGYLTLVEKETERCSTIISSLLTFSRKSEPRFTEVDLKDLMERSLLLSRHKLELSGIEPVLHVAGELPSIQGDANQLQQCLINLIFNAVDAMPNGGTLTLSGSHDPAEKRVILQVQDTGAGIREQDLPHIFEPFFTTKKEGYGVGLGLPTVFGIIEHHGGTVTVESRTGQTLFTIGLPL